MLATGNPCPESVKYNDCIIACILKGFIPTGKADDRSSHWPNRRD